MSRQQGRQQGRHWRITVGGVLAAALAVALGLGAAVAQPPGAGAAATAARWYRLQVTQTGLYRITCADLAAAGAPTARLDLGTLRVFAGRPQAAGGLHPDAAVELPLRPVAVRTGCTDPTAGVEFWGAAPARHTSAAALAEGRGADVLDEYSYWLALDAGPGLRMAHLASIPGGALLADVQQTLTLEENHYYRPSLPPPGAGASGAGGVHDHWFWELLAAGGSLRPQMTVHFALADLTISPPAAGAGGTLRITLGGLGGAHALDVYVNEAYLGRLRWNGTALYTGELAVAWGVLHTGDNTIRLAAVESAGLVLLDRLALDYMRALRLTPGAGTAALTTELPPGAWQLAAAGGAEQRITVLDVTEPSRPQEILPICDAVQCLALWGVAGEQPRTYALVGESGRLTTTLAPLLPLRLRTPQVGADYILLTPQALLGEAERLAALRRAEGLRVAVVPAEDVYAEFGVGSERYGAAAIAAFLTYARAHWQPPAPSYLLLLGGGSFDEQGFCRIPGNCPEVPSPPGDTWLPPLLAPADPWLGETAADNRYAALALPSNLPQMAIGRLPAANAAEARTMIDAILAYETEPLTAAGAAEPSGSDEPAQVQMLLVADNAFGTNGAPDSAGNFWQLSEAAFGAAAVAAAQAGQTLAAERLYLNICSGLAFPTCSLPNPPYAPFADAQSLVAALGAKVEAQAPDTALIIHYVGHGAIGSWGGNPTILHSAGVAGLRRSSVPPLVIDMSCYTGYFVYPGLRSLAETWLTAGGAVGVIASSGLGIAGGHAVLDAALLETIAAKPHLRLGDALLAAKYAAFAAGGPPADIDTFTLFGDPALHVRPHTLKPTPPAPPTPSVPPTPSTPTPSTPAPGVTPPATPSVTTTSAPTPAPRPETTPSPSAPGAERCVACIYLPWLAGQTGER
jgi:hypothetical protein